MNIQGSSLDRGIPKSHLSSQDSKSPDLSISLYPDKLSILPSSAYHLLEEEEVLEANESFEAVQAWEAVLSLETLKELITNLIQINKNLYSLNELIKQNKKGTIHLEKNINPFSEVELSNYSSLIFNLLENKLVPVEARLGEARSALEHKLSDLQIILNAKSNMTEDERNLYIEQLSKEMGLSSSRDEKSLLRYIENEISQYRFKIQKTEEFIKLINELDLKFGNISLQEIQNIISKEQDSSLKNELVKKVLSKFQKKVQEGDLSGKETLQQVIRIIDENIKKLKNLYKESDLPEVYIKKPTRIYL